MIAAVVLAAGGSSRMGRPKLLLPFRGRSFVVSVCEEALASSVDRVLADQPFVTREHLGTLLEAQKRSRAGLAASEANGRLGAPAVFGPAFYPALLRASGDEGARKLLRNNRAVAAIVPLPEAALEVDTPLDYERVAAL